MKQQKLSSMLQRLPLAKPPPRSAPEDEEDDNDDEDWDATLSSLGKKPSTKSQSSNSTKPSEKLLSKKKKENRENDANRKQKKKSYSVLSGSFVSALAAQKLGEKRKLEQPQKAEKIVKQSKAIIPPTSTLESELLDDYVEENAKPATQSQNKSNLTVADQYNSRVCKEQEAQTTGTASNHKEMKAHAVSPTLCSLDGEEHSEAMPKVDTTSSDKTRKHPKTSRQTKRKLVDAALAILTWTISSPMPVWKSDLCFHSSAN
jgi:hypothetical protein